MSNTFEPTVFDTAMSPWPACFDKSHICVYRTLSGHNQTGHQVRHARAGREECDAHDRVGYAECKADDRYLRAGRFVNALLTLPYHPHIHITQHSYPRDRRDEGEHEIFLQMRLAAVGNCEIHGHAYWIHQHPLYEGHVTDNCVVVVGVNTDA